MLTNYRFSVVGIFLGLMLAGLGCGENNGLEQSQSAHKLTEETTVTALVSVRTDEQKYTVGDGIIITVNNDGNLSAFLPGCNQYRIEKKDADGWSLASWGMITCIWEGIAVEVKGYDSYTAAVKAAVEGTYRIKLTYGVGCVSDRPLSKADCVDEITVFSDSFTVEQQEEETEVGENEKCSKATDAQCKSGQYCALGMSGNDSATKTGVCLPYGQCSTVADCKNPNNQWFAPACVGKIVCNEGACGKNCSSSANCNPEKEWYRKYFSTDKEECTKILFQCPANTQYFGNECGCGCEQDASCPRWINCMPPLRTPCSELRARCPFSKVAY